ncbi:PPE family protein [Mycobacterium tuberculosis]|nr:PPE family protein [Mycobacterium tuberculosis]
MCILLRRLCKVHPVPAIIGESFLGRWQCEQNYRGVDTSCGGCRWGLVSGWEGEWVMEFPVLPPEINSVLMYSGAGSSPLLAAAAAWDGLAEELGSAAVSFGQVTSGLTAGVWQGAAAAAMAAAAAPYAGWLGSVAAQAVAGDIARNECHPAQRDFNVAFSGTGLGALAGIGAQRFDADVDAAQRGGISHRAVDDQPGPAGRAGQLGDDITDQRGVQGPGAVDDQHTARTWLREHRLQQRIVLKTPHGADRSGELRSAAELAEL